MSVRGWSCVIGLPSDEVVLEKPSLGIGSYWSAGAPHRHNRRALVGLFKKYAMGLS